MPGLLDSIGNGIGAVGRFARGVGYGVAGAVGAIPAQIGQEFGQYRQAAGSLLRGDFGGAAESYANANLIGRDDPMTQGFMQGFQRGRGSVVGRGYIGGSGRGGGASRAGGRVGQRQLADHEMGQIAERTRQTQGATDSQEWVNQAPARGGLLRGPGTSTGGYGGEARLGASQAAAGERHLREMIARQHQRPDAER